MSSFTHTLKRIEKVLQRGVAARSLVNQQCLAAHWQ